MSAGPANALGDVPVGHRRDPGRHTHQQHIPATTQRINVTTDTRSTIP